MQLALYRSVMHLTYPDESFSYCYAFQPIQANELSRDGHLACWTDDSGAEPFAVVEIPEGSLLTETEDGWQLQVPDQPIAIDAEEVLLLATNCSMGLVFIQQPQPEVRTHYWDSD
jgi:hypothetical protein